MSSMLCYAFIFFSALANSFFQLDVGGLLLLYHSSQKKHISKKTRSLATNLVFGALFMLVIFLAATAFFLQIVSGGNLKTEFFSLIVGILLSLSILFFTVYYKFGNSTELWLPRSITRYISNRSKITSSRTEAFSLGMLTILAEFPFSAVLFLIASDSILKLSNMEQFFGVLIYALIATLPLSVCRIFIRKGSTIVDIQRWRIKNKPFLKFICGFCFIILAVFVFTFKIVGEIF